MVPAPFLLEGDDGRGIDSLHPYALSREARINTDENNTPEALEESGGAAPQQEAPSITEPQATPGPDAVRAPTRSRNEEWEEMPGDDIGNRASGVRVPDDIGNRRPGGPAWRAP